jgi:single-strand DNA-binding protein
VSVNKVILIGNLGGDPEVRYLEQDRVVANVSLATSESYTDKQGNKVSQTEWHKLEFWDNLAKIAEKYLSKGKQIYVEGKIKTDQWTDKDGNNKSVVRIRVSQLQMLGGKESGKSGADEPSGGNTEKPASPELNEDGLPF